MIFSNKILNHILLQHKIYIMLNLIICIISVRVACTIRRKIYSELPKLSWPINSVI
jgi:hypothetical protein